MAEKIPTPMEWMDRHPAEYDRLFDQGTLDSRAGEILPRLPQLDPDERIPLSFLARHSDTSKRLLPAHTSLIRRGVRRILGASFNGVFGAEHAFLQDLTLQEYGAIEQRVARLILVWQRSCKQYRMSSPFEPLYNAHDDVPLDSVERPPIKLVLMGAAALCYVRYSCRDESSQIKNISTYGP